MGRRINSGNQALKIDPRGVKLIDWPRKMEKVVSFSVESVGGANRVVKLYVRGTLG
jgi:hypothetical protein